MSLLKIIKNFFTYSPQIVEKLTKEEIEAVKILNIDGTKRKAFIRHEIEIQRLKKYINSIKQKDQK